MTVPGFPVGWSPCLHCAEQNYTICQFYTMCHDCWVNKHHCEIALGPSGENMVHGSETPQQQYDVTTQLLKLVLV